MGRVKEIFMEVQEMYDGEVPVNFDYEAYLAMRAEQIAAERETKINKVLPKVSECCGANMETLVTIDGPDYLDLGICPKCNDHCSIKEV